MFLWGSVFSLCIASVHGCCRHDQVKRRTNVAQGFATVPSKKVAGFHAQKAHATSRVKNCTKEEVTHPRRYSTKTPSHNTGEGGTRSIILHLQNTHTHLEVDSDGALKMIVERVVRESQHDAVGLRASKVYGKEKEEGVGGAPDNKQRGWAGG